MQERQLPFFILLIISPDPYFEFMSGLLLFKNDT